MTFNMDEDLVEGAIVEHWEPVEDRYEYRGRVKLVEKQSCRDPELTFIYEGCVYSYDCWLVDIGFISMRRVYFRISDSTNEPSLDYTERYTYNITHEYKGEMLDNFGEFFGDDENK